MTIGQCISFNLPSIKDVDDMYNILKKRSAIGLSALPAFHPRSGIFFFLIRPQWIYTGIPKNDTLIQKSLVVDFTHTTFDTYISKSWISSFFHTFISLLFYSKTDHTHCLSYPFFRLTRLKKDVIILSKKDFSFFFFFLLFFIYLYPLLLSILLLQLYFFSPLVSILF